MTFLLFCLILFSGTCSVAGQIFFKLAMSGHVSRRKPRRLLDLAAGVLAMTFGFFTWLALLPEPNLERMPTEESASDLFRSDGPDVAALSCQPLPPDMI